MVVPPLVVVGHGAGAALLHGQAGLGAVERLDLALLVDREHDGMRRRVDIEGDHVPELVDELRVGGELELPHPMRLQAMGPPNALHRADGDAGLFGHPCGRPIGRLGGRVGQGQRHHALGHLGAERRNARGPRLVAQKPVEAFFGKAFLPAPDAGLRFAGLPHDLVRAKPGGRQKHDLGPPSVLLGGVAVSDHGAKPHPIGSRYFDGNASAHAADLHAPRLQGIPPAIQMSELIH